MVIEVGLIWFRGFGIVESEIGIIGIKSWNTRGVTLAKKHNCCRGTLKSWIDGGMMKSQSSAQCIKLMPEEEAVLVQYLIETAKCGFPDTPRHAAMRANCILRERTSDPTACVGQNWINHFLNRHKTQLS